MKFTLRLNGTKENPYEQYGLTQNPFPAIAKYGYQGANKILADLAACPIKNETDLRERLEGCSTEFIEGCVQRFQPGVMVTVECEFPD